MKILATTAFLLAASFSVGAVAAEPDGETGQTSATLLAYDEQLPFGLDEWDWESVEIGLELNG